MYLYIPPDPRLTKKVINWDFNSNRSNPWCRDMKHIFTNLDMVTIYENSHLCNFKQTEGCYRMIEKH